MTSHRIETLAEVVKKRIVIPIFDCVVIDKMDQPPTAMQIAAAIVAAAKETGANPEAVALGARGNRYHPDILRARAYAALALRACFEDFGKQSIARMVGASSWTTYIATLDEQMACGFLDWWDDKAFMRVVEAIERAPAQ